MQSLSKKKSLDVWVGGVWTKQSEAKQSKAEQSSVSMDGCAARRAERGAIHATRWQEDNDEHEHERWPPNTCLGGGVNCQGLGAAFGDRVLSVSVRQG